MSHPIYCFSTEFSHFHPIHLITCFLPNFSISFMSNRVCVSLFMLSIPFSFFCRPFIPCSPIISSASPALRPVFLVFFSSSHREREREREDVGSTKAERRRRPASIQGDGETTLTSDRWRTAEAERA
ncbi:hypothetical protein Dimus_039349 [Dionaea muscipula]